VGLGGFTGRLIEPSPILVHPIRAASSSAALRARFLLCRDRTIAVRRILREVNFVVCPYDGTNLKAAGRPAGLTVQLLCPACGKRFELDRGNVVEQPPDETQGGSDV
jgi:hypothetical protein